MEKYIKLTEVLRVNATDLDKVKYREWLLPLGSFMVHKEKEKTTVILNSENATNRYLGEIVESFEQIEDMINGKIYSKRRKV